MRLRRDKNHRQIVSDLRKIGCTIIDTSQVGGGFFDIVAGYQGKTYLIEIKSDTSYGKKGLSESQKNFTAKWKGGKILVIKSLEDFLREVKNENLR